MSDTFGFNISNIDCIYMRCTQTVKSGIVFPLLKDEKKNAKIIWLEHCDVSNKYVGRASANSYKCPKIYSGHAI